MNGFEERLKKANRLQDEVIEFLDLHSIQYILSGYEYLKSTTNGRGMITKNNDKTSLFIRHYPDISLIYKDKSCLLEVKNSSGIERECYCNYLSLANEMGINVFMYLKNHKISNVKDVVFSEISSYDNIAKMEIPVIDSIWKTPRLLPGSEYQQYLHAYKNKKKYTSGCAFAFIDFSKTKFHDRETLINTNKKQQ